MALNSCSYGRRSYEEWTNRDLALKQVLRLRQTVLMANLSVTWLQVRASIPKGKGLLQDRVVCDIFPTQTSATHTRFSSLGH